MFDRVKAFIRQEEKDGAQWFQLTKTVNTKNAEMQKIMVRNE